MAFNPGFIPKQNIPTQYGNPTNSNGFIPAINFGAIPQKLSGNKAADILPFYNGQASNKPNTQPLEASYAAPAGDSGAYAGGGSSGRGGGGGGSAVAPGVAAFYDDQLGQVQSALGRIGTQRDIGNRNIDSQLNSALNRLFGQNATAERDYGINKQRTIDDNVSARAKVDENVSRQSAGLRRLLGNNSSASEFAAPLAVAKQGNTQLGDIQTGYSRNLQSLDTADEDRKRAFQDSQSDIQTQGQTQRNSLQAGLAEREASLLDQMSNLQVQKAQAKGQSYETARSMTQGNNSRVNSLLAQIDQLGLNPTIAPKTDLKFVAPELAKYQTSDINIAPGASPVQSAAGQFYNLLGLDDRRKQQV